ncbi:threonine/serine exporter family protein [Sansalvadorimonas verongulae]|uniref:threonine/serine exporter family protein n=1 Tax=Sansalvadorimonas verongulae TaxID=2172824 RepID=UPI0012BC4EEA|nr:threonine/serine exporter family protein [Sansalvadorimonas verongulae]MTI14622.1 threonine/serine exporter [Sansalvadorimonas verongulae]
MSEWLNHLLSSGETAAMAAMTAAAFAVFFSVPARTLLATAALGAFGITVKFSLMHIGWSVIEGSFIASVCVGLCGMVLAWLYHTPTAVFSLPAVIPMVPGVFAYRTMLGVLEFTRAAKMDQALLMNIISNGLTTAFILLCLAIGVALPNLLMRGQSIRRVFGKRPLLMANK